MRGCITGTVKKSIMTMMITIGVCVLSLSMFESDMTHAAEQSGKEAIASVKGELNEKLYFGHYEQDGNLENGSELIEWEVKDVLDGKAMFVSTKILDVKLYDDKTTWKNSAVREWLNDEFLKTAFTGEEAALIETSSLETISKDFNTKGNLDIDKTKDKIFLMSFEELEREVFAEKYNSWRTWDSDACICKGTEYAKNAGLWVSAPGNRYGDYPEEKYGGGFWYLRDGHCITDMGYLFCSDEYYDWLYNPPVDMKQGIRPAFWAKISDNAVSGLSSKKETLKAKETTVLRLEGDMYPTWESSDTNIAYVYPDGTVYGYKKGKATITALSRNGKKYSCKLTVTDPGNFERDSKGRVIKEPLWDDIYSVYEYDKNGNVKKQTEYHSADGTVYATFEYSYDENNRKSKMVRTIEGNTETVNYEYHKNGIMKKQSVKGANSLYVYEYDDKGSYISTHTEHPDWSDESVIVVENSTQKNTYYKDGKIKQSQVIIEDGDGNVISKEVFKYTKDGNLSYDAQYNGKGELIQKDVNKYNTNGEIIKSTGIRKGERAYEGEEEKTIKKKEYYKNGNIKKETVVDYVDGKEKRRIVYLYNKSGQKYHTEINDSESGKDKYDYSKYTSRFGPSVPECWWG